MIKTLTAVVRPDLSRGYHQTFDDACTGYERRLEYDTAEGICTEYLSRGDAPPVCSTESMTDDVWDRRCDAYCHQFAMQKRCFPEADISLTIDTKEIIHDPHN